MAQLEKMADKMTYNKIRDEFARKPVNVWKKEVGAKPKVCKLFKNTKIDKSYCKMKNKPYNRSVNDSYIIFKY